MAPVYKINQLLHIFWALQINKCVAPGQPIRVSRHHNFLHRCKLFAEPLDLFDTGIIWQVHEIDPPAEERWLDTLTSITFFQIWSSCANKVVDRIIVKRFNGLFSDLAILVLNDNFSRILT